MSPNPTPPVAFPDSVAMRFLLEAMRDTPGAVSSSAGSGAAAWALGRIAHLEDVVKALAPWSHL